MNQCRVSEVPSKVIMHLFYLPSTMICRIALMCRFFALWWNLYAHASCKSVYTNSFLKLYLRLKDEKTYTIPCMSERTISRKELLQHMYLWPLQPSLPY